MNDPDIRSSTRDQRRAFVEEQWRCTHNCEMCGKCSMLRGRQAEILYADYIEGGRTYMDITFELRDRNY